MCDRRLAERQQIDFRVTQPGGHCLQGCLKRWPDYLRVHPQIAVRAWPSCYANSCAEQNTVGYDLKSAPDWSESLA